MGDRLPEPHASSSPAVAASSEAEEIEVLDSEDVLPMAAEDWDICPHLNGVVLQIGGYRNCDKEIIINLLLHLLKFVISYPIISPFPGYLGTPVSNPSSLYTDC
ncbi:hypothetical protein TURU_030107 [Turdus rufiventris]|nr:hypothetical protein TURU_030107 [Turdus rufiventris]